jgi:predicted AlkP superfamily phosphohydrolase/phosphomutase
MKPPGPRVVVLAIDAGNPELIEGWSAAGHLPNLRALAARGLSGRTRSVDGFFVGSTWPSLYTGVSPAGHGHHSLVQLRPGSYDYHDCADGPLVTRPAFWRHLSDAGRRVAILDVPLTRAESRLNGIQSVEWGAHDAVYGFHTYPHELAGEIAARHGTHPLGRSCDGQRCCAADYEGFVARLEQGVAKKTALTTDLFAREPWDFAMQVFTEAHCAGHQCWHLHDPAHPAHDPAVRAAVGDPLLRVYRALDGAIGEILEATQPELAIVLSAHGMSYWYGAQFLLREILFRLGHCRPEPASPRPFSPRGAALDAAGWCWNRLPSSVRARLSPLRQRLGPQAAPAGPPSLAVDVRTSRCFPVNNGLVVGGIRLNLAGREPHGLLQPGDETDRFCHELARDLCEIVDERTGAPLVRAVRRTRDLYQGEALEALPDLLVEWNDAVPTGSTLLHGGAGARVRAHSAKIGTVDGVNSFGRSGEHRPEGFLIAAGEGIAPGRLAAPVSILDLAPTFTGLFGLDLPGADGKPIAPLMAWRG